MCDCNEEPALSGIYKRKKKKCKTIPATSLEGP
jgi:hypothetical protein